MTVQSKRAAIIPKSIMPIYRTAQELQNFREQLHAQFEHRADSTMDLLDALMVWGTLRPQGATNLASAK
jgi:hypothetical protein